MTLERAKTIPAKQDLIVMNIPRTIQDNLYHDIQHKTSFFDSLKNEFKERHAWHHFLTCDVHQVLFSHKTSSTASFTITTNTGCLSLGPN
jgi:hypothetical protein